MTAARSVLRLAPDGATTGADLVEEWADWYRAAGASENTITTRVTGVRLLLASAGADDPVWITSRQVVGWLARCRTQATRATYAASARAWFKWLVEQGYRDDNPMVKVPSPRQPRGVPRPVSSPALAAALKVAPRKARAYMTLAAYAGLRVHEIAKVRGEDFSDGWLYVTGKGNKPAAIPVHPLIEQIRRGFPEQGYWFAGADDGHVQSGTVTKTVTRAFRKAGYNVTAHQLRHWYGTWLQRTTKDIRVTQELMRHASLASTQIYTEVTSEAKVNAVRRLEL